MQNEVDILEMYALNWWLENIFTNGHSTTFI